MKNTVIFLGVIISAAITWFGYALFASLITDGSLNKCFTDDTVITFLMATGWILPSLVGLDLYRHLNRHEIRREKRIDREIREIKTNTFRPNRKPNYSSLMAQHHLN